MPRVLHEAYERGHKTIAHLTVERVTMPDAERDWPIDDLLHELDKQVAEFHLQQSRGKVVACELPRLGPPWTRAVTDERTAIAAKPIFDRARHLQGKTST